MKQFPSKHKRQAPRTETARPPGASAADPGGIRAGSPAPSPVTAHRGLPGDIHDSVKSKPDTDIPHLNT